MNSIRADATYDMCDLGGGGVVICEAHTRADVRFASRILKRFSLKPFRLAATTHARRFFIAVRARIRRRKPIPARPNRIRHIVSQHAGTMRRIQQRIRIVSKPVFDFWRLSHHIRRNNRMCAIVRILATIFVHVSPQESDCKVHRLRNLTSPPFEPCTTRESHRGLWELPPHH